MMIVITVEKTVMDGMNRGEMMNVKRMVISFLLIQTDEGDLERIKERVRI